MLSFAFKAILSIVAADSRKRNFDCMYALLDRGEYERAIKRSRIVLRQNPILAGFVPELHITHVCEQLDKLGAQIVTPCWKLCAQAYKLYHALSASAPVHEHVHYTKLERLCSIAKEERVRLYNASSMSDTSEGLVLSNMLSTANNMYTAEIHDYFQQGINFPFLFSTIINSQPEDANACLWQTYGGDGSGCAIVLEKITSDETKALRDIRYKHSVEGKMGDVLLNECHFSPVVYTDKVAMDTYMQKKAEKVSCLLVNLYRLISKGNSAYQEKAKKLVSHMMQPVRFAFKEQDYKNEVEARLIIFRPSKEAKYDRNLKRHYVIGPKGLPIKKVIFGSKVKGCDELEKKLRKSAMFKQVEMLQAR